MRNLMIFAVLLLSSSVVSANCVVRRAGSDLSAWVSVDASGRPSTVTPVITTIGGTATTINPIPASLTASPTSASANTAATTTEGAPTPTAIAGGAFEVCHNTNGPFAPFCAPINGSILYLGDTNYVTWDTSHFKPNSTVFIQANFLNMTTGEDLHLQAFQSDKTPNSWGFISWTQQKDYLQGSSYNNLTLYITSEGQSITGPTVQIAASHPSAPLTKTPLPDKQSLLIALPTVLGFVCLCLVGGFFWNRRHRKIGLGNVMGRRKGYGVAKSRRQRMGATKRSGAMELRLREIDPENVYRDDPVEQHARVTTHHRNDSDALGSLVGTPTEERSNRKNVFQDEIRRQEDRL